MTPDDLTIGDEITAAWLGSVNDAIRAAGVTPDPRSGLVGYSGPSGSALRIQAAPDGFFKVTASADGSPPTAALLEQVDTANGGWADGKRVVAKAYALPGSTAPPSGSIVYAWKGRANWLFEWRSCS